MKRFSILVLILFALSAPAYAQMSKDKMPAQDMPMMQMCMPMMQQMMGHSMMMKDMMNMMVDVMKMQRKMLRGMSDAEKAETMKEIDQMISEMQKMISDMRNMMMPQGEPQKERKDIALRSSINTKGVGSTIIYKSIS